jgi:hypothetical protein
MRDILSMMLFYIKNDSSDLYFDWFRMEEMYRRLWAQFEMQFDQFQTCQGRNYNSGAPYHEPPSITFNILNQAYTGE